MNIPEPIGIYVRVSTVEQVQEGYSIQEQTERIKSYCKAMGWGPATIYSDPGYSGASLDRPAIKNLIKDVRSGFCKKVIVWKLDRLSRSQKDMLILLEDVFLENDCHFVSLMESFDTSTPFGRCIVGILAAFAQMERENIKARMTMGKQAGIKAGNYYATKVPVGYRRELQPDGKNALVVDPYSSKIVEEMYRLYNSGKSLGDIAAYLQGHYGYKVGTDRRTVADRVSRIMRNPVYAGRVRMRNLECEGKHDAIVSNELWQAVNDRLAQNKKNIKRRYNGSDGLVSGLLFCGDCGARLAIRPWSYVGKGKPRIKRYVCYSVSKCDRRLVRSDNCSNRSYFAVEELDELVLNEIKKLSLNPAAVDVLIEEAAPEEKQETEAFKDRLAEVEKQINRLLNLYQSGVMDLPEINGRLSELKEERGRLHDLIEEAEAERSGKLPKKDALKGLASLSGIVESGDNAALYDLVHALIEKIVILNGDITIYWAFA